MKQQLYGYRRPDGKVGIRNKVLILPTCSCSSDTAQKISAIVPNTVTFSNQAGCSQTNLDVQYMLDTLVGFACNPNIYGTIIIGLGCEVCGASRIADLISQRTNKPLASFIIQEEGGTLGTIEKASEVAAKMVQDASKVSREEIEWSDIIFATECGGSDATSGIAANPVIGKTSDLIVEHGGTVILSETPEFIGAEKILAKRAKTTELGEKILEMVSNVESYMKQLHTDLRDSNPAPGNKKGGISSLEEKSLGCIYKGGSTVIQDVIGYAKEVKSKGLVIMDTPGNDACSLCAMAAGGAVVAAFSSGRGTPLGNAIMPVIKVTGNRDTYQKMKCNIDLDASPVIYGGKKIDELGEELFQMTGDVINGTFPKAEAMGNNEFSVARYCNFT